MIGGTVATLKIHSHYTSSYTTLRAEFFARQSTPRQCSLCRRAFAFFPLNKELNILIYSYFEKRLSKKNVHATIPKGNMGYDQYTTVVVEVTFAAFLRIHKWSLVPFCQISSKNNELKTTHNILWDCRVHVFPTDNLSRNSCIFSAYIFTGGLYNLDQFRRLKTVNSL